MLVLVLVVADAVAVTVTITITVTVTDEYRTVHRGTEKEEARDRQAQPLDDAYRTFIVNVFVKHGHINVAPVRGFLARFFFVSLLSPSILDGSPKNQPIN